MKNIWFPFLGIIFLTIILYSCKQLYSPVVADTNTNYLVIEGIINTGSDSTIIKLSRTVNLNNKIATKAEPTAKVTIESDNNATYALTEIKTGVYASAPLHLNKAAKYRLRIVTSNSKTYLSDFVPVKESPVIDSLTYATPAQGLQIFVNTHDATSNTRYYRWEFTETWKFHSGISTNIIMDGTRFAIRNQQVDNIFFCWSSHNSNDLILASSAKLTKDVIYQTLITTVPAPSEKVSLGYSILVKQYALTEDAFNFWEILKRNTEQLGGIFDAQPSALRGNVHNVNDITEPVFGYVSAGTTQQKRITVLYQKWPQGWGAGDAVYKGCKVDTILKRSYSDYFYGPLAPYLPIDPVTIFIPPPAGPLIDTIGHTASSRFCMDCRVRGTNVVPSFWPHE